MSETEYTAICDGGPNELDKHPIVYLDLTDGCLLYTSPSPRD